MHLDLLALSSDQLSLVCRMLSTGCSVKCIQNILISGMSCSSAVIISLRGSGVLQQLHTEFKQGILTVICPGSPRGVEDQQVSMFVDLQGAVCVGAAEGVGCIDGGRGQSFRHGHPHIDTGQVHDDWLREDTREGGINGEKEKTETVFHLLCQTHHGAAVRIGVEVAAEGNDHASFQHVSGPRLRQSKHTQGLLDVSQL